MVGTWTPFEKQLLLRAGVPIGHSLDNRLVTLHIRALSTPRHHHETCSIFRPGVDTKRTQGALIYRACFSDREN